MSRILVAYASKAGSTGEVADAIGQALSATGTTVTVRPVKEVADVSGYDAVVVGSAIRIGNWLPEAKAFLETHHAALERMPVACFSVCLRVTEDSPEARQEVERYNDAAGALIAPVSAAVFGGEMDYSRLSFVERMMMKAMNAPEGDWRDWEAIHVWAESLRLTLIGG